MDENPYRSPTTALNDDNADLPRRRRPILLALLVFGAIVSGALAFLFIVMFIAFSVAIITEGTWPLLSRVYWIPLVGSVSVLVCMACLKAIREQRRRPA